MPRSSLTGTQWVIQNSPGLGDPDYRGEYQVRFRAFPDKALIPSETFRKLSETNLQENYTALRYPKFPYKVGDRVAQMYIEEIIPIEFEEVAELSETVRGAGGFGHTGNN